MTRHASQGMDQSRVIRVLCLTTSFPTSESDFSGIFILRLTRALSARSTRVVVLTPSGVNTAFSPTGLSVHRFRYAPLSWQRIAHQPGGIPATLASQPGLYALVPSFLASMGNNLLRLARTHDLIHANWSICGALAGLLRPLHGRPVVTTLRGSDMDRAARPGVFSWFHRKTVQGSDYSVGVSQAIADELRGRYPSLANRITFIPNGVDDAFYALPGKRHPKQPSPLRLLFVGSFIPRKGLDVLFHALAKIAEEPSWTMTLAGDGPERGTLSALASSLEIESRVRFLGLIRPDKIHEVMSGHHLLVLPSHREGRPNAVLEAMAAAMPVVATDIDGTRELIRDGLTGWLVPPGNEEALAQVLMCLVRGKKDLTSVGMAGRQWMLEQGLTWNETACRYRLLYLRALDSRAAEASRK